MNSARVSSGERGRLDSVQALRACAAIAVIFAHAISRLARTFPHAAPSSIFANAWQLSEVGHAGVDIFFVISGFIMLFVHSNHFQRPGASREFFIRRLMRIAPLYWILTTVGLVLLFVAPSLFTYHTSFDVPWAIGSYLFIPITPVRGAVAPIVGVGWTLNYEMYFYVVFAAMLFLSRRAGVGLMAGIFFLSVAAGEILQPTVPWLKLLTDWLLLEFLLGVGVAYAVVQFGLPKSRALCLGAIAIGFCAIMATMFRIPPEGYQRFIFWGLPSAAIVYGTLGLKISGTTFYGRLALALGDGSYSLYLFQVFALPAAAIGFRVAHLDRFVPFDVQVVLLTVVSTAAGMACWRLVERPVTVWLRDARNSSRKARDAQAVTP